MSQNWVLNFINQLASYAISEQLATVHCFFTLCICDQSLLLSKFKVFALNTSSLNQACTSYRPTPGFLKMFLCRCLCVCTPLRPLITSGVIWTTYDWLNKFYSCYNGNCSHYHELGVALALIHIMETNPIRVSKHCIRHFSL